MTKKVILKDKNNEELIPYTSLATGTEAGRVRPDGTTLGVDANGVLSVNQGLIDTVDGKISNCILEIPQNIKLTLENNVVTLKAGSTVLRGGEVYNTYTLTEDKSLTISSSLENGRYFLFTNNTGTPLVTIQNRFGSGTTLPEDSSTYGRFFITTNKTFYNWSGAQNAWVESGVTYPIAMIDVVNGVASFAKDSNGNDMIFNGAGFVGHHAFVYPNVKALIPDGLNADGSLKSISVARSALTIREILGSQYFSIGTATAINPRPSYFEVNTLDDLYAKNIQGFYYVKSINQCYSWSGGSGVLYAGNYVFIHVNISGTTVTDFTIRQPVRLATTEITDKIQSQVDTNTTAISGKQDTLVSGTNIKTINSTTVLGNGNFALADKSLSNLDSNGQMIIDSQNGTISNCILEIPQNIKLELSNNVLTLKRGSILVNSGSTYSTYTTTSDLTVTAPNTSATEYMIFMYGNNNFAGAILDNIVSGSTDSKSGVPYHIWFDTTNKIINRYGSDGTTAIQVRYPICIVKTTSAGGSWDSFVKDSNGNNMIFNGAGFIGHHVFVYPGVKGLAPKGFNDDRTLSNLAVNTNALSIQETTTLSGRCIGFQGGNNIGSFPYKIVDTVDELEQQFIYQYCNETNTVWLWRSNAWSKDTRRLPIIDYNYDGTTVTDFTIRQPVRLATTENTYTKEQADTKLASKQDTLVSGTNIKTINSTTVLGNGNFALADKSLSNLDSNGQMIIDSQNGTISNCILEIPQNIKLTLENNVLTLKSGSVLTDSGETYQTITITSDKTTTISTSSNNRWLIFATRSGVLAPVVASACVSGETDSKAEQPIHIWFDTTNKEVLYYGSDGTTGSHRTYPLCVIDVVDGVASFAKDSNGNDMIFNGTGFIGHHAFRLPNVSGYTGEGFTSGGKLNSNFYSPKNLIIQEMVSTNPSYGKKAIGFQSATRMNYIEVDTVTESPAHQHISWIYTYVKEQNNMWVWTGTVLVKQHESPLVYYNYNGTTVTDFTISQPYQGARNLLTDDLYKQIGDASTYKGTYDSTVQYYEGDIVKSGTGFFEALQDNINISTANTANWSKLSNDALVINYEKSDNTEYPIGLADANASGRAYIGPLFFTTQNKPTINASTGVITATGGVVGKTETAGDNSTKYATTAFIQTELANKFRVVTALPANPDANTFYFIVEE